MGGMGWGLVGFLVWGGTGGGLLGQGRVFFLRFPFLEKKSRGRIENDDFFDIIVLQEE